MPARAHELLASEQDVQGLDLPQLDEVQRSALHPRQERLKGKTRRFPRLGADHPVGVVLVNLSR